MKALRVAFAGASGTGKTTLARWVSETWDLPLNPVGSRSVAKAMGYDNPYDVDKAGKRAEFQRRLITDKRAWEQIHEVFVSDRTTIDNLVYTMLHDVHAIDRKLLDGVIQGLGRYTHIIICPVYVFCNLGGDRNRVDNMVYQELFDATLRTLVYRYTPNTVHVMVLREKLADSRRACVEQLLEDHATVLGTR